VPSTPTPSGPVASLAPTLAARLPLTPPTAEATVEESSPPPAFDPARLIHEEKVSQPEDIVRVLLDLYVPGGIRPEARAKLIAFIALDKPSDAALDQRVREAVHAILTMPEYQLA
jgi:hypothetical protein